MTSSDEDEHVPFMKQPFCVYKGHTADLLDVSWSKVLPSLCMVFCTGYHDGTFAMVFCCLRVCICVSIELKNRIVKNALWSVVLCASET